MRPTWHMRSSSLRPVAAVAAHPLVAPMPRLIGPARHLARRLVLGALADSPGRLDLVLPDGERRVLGRGDLAVATVRVHDDRAFARLLWRGELGAGEAYTAGDWDADDLPAALRWFLRATGARGVESALTRLAALPSLWRHRRAANDRAGSARNIVAHYDLGNRFYREFLDDELVYSCGIWADATTLAEAQRAKLERLCALAAIG